MGSWQVLILGTVLLIGAVAFSPIAVAEEEWEEYLRTLRDPNYRLPFTTKPSNYEVTLTPFLDTPPEGKTPFTFEGDVKIIFDVVHSNITEIVLHCNDLTIENITLQDMHGDFIEVKDRSPKCEMPYSFLRIQLGEHIYDYYPNYVLRIKFRGNIQDNMRGFYRSWYNDENGVKTWIGTTQFQPGHARQAFPCYDEPGFKATFDITIIRDRLFRPSISNMPIKNEVELANGLISETFYTTPMMSTYLIAFIVSKYEIIASGKNESRPFDIYARSNAINTGEWSLEIGELLLDAMEHYTNYDYYDMAKNMSMKQAAIPDFSAGAMENWGLLTYREALILYDPRNSNHFYKQRVANIISHEIAHMWFGNLVTCAWWDNLWLNEGFARFYQYYLTNSVRKDMGYDTRFIVEQVHTAMFSDSSDDAHALTNPDVSDPTSVSAHFSVITYAKGAAVLRMTQHLLGEDTYVKGLRQYLKDRAFSTAEPHQLFEALDMAAIEDNALSAFNGIQVYQYFRTWTENAGHPLVTVSVNQRTGRMFVTQDRWERNIGVSAYANLWHIPITWTRAGAADFENLKPSRILTQQATVMERGTTGLEWVIFNKQESGFYRVNYDDTNWALITKALRSADREVIHEYNRAQIVDDLFALARAGVLPYNRIFNTLSFLEFEDQYAPWLAAISGFNFLRRRLAHDADNLGKLDALINNELSKAVVARLGVSERDGDGFMDSLLRMYLMNFLCNLGHEQCVAKGQEMFRSWVNGTFVPANMRPWVYCEGLRVGNADDFDFFWRLYQAENLASEKDVMLQAAGCTTNETSLVKFLNAIVARSDDVRPQDYSTALNSAVTRNEENTMKAFRWLRDNVKNVTETLGSASNPINSIASRLLNENQINEFSAWLEANRDLLGSAYNTGINAVQDTKNNLEWSAKRTVEMAQYFETGYIDVEIVEESEEDGDNILLHYTL